MDSRRAWWSGLLAFILAAVTLGSSTPAQALDDGLGEQSSVDRADRASLYHQREILVKFRPDTPELQQAASLQAMGAIKIANTKQGVSLLGLPVGLRVEAALDRLRKDPAVLYAEPNYVVKATGMPPVNDPLYPDLWGLPAIQAPEAWAWLSANVPADRGPVTVAVIDSGIKLDHPDLMPHLAGPGKDFVNNDDEAMDDGGHHGTHVAGTIAGVANNGTGVAGVAGEGQVRLLPVKVLDATGNGYTFNVIRGIEWAVDNGAQVINLSLGSVSSSQAEADVVAYALAKGVTVVAASGNHAQDNDKLAYPGSYPGVITVGAVDASLQVAAFSVGGASLDIVAPGVGVWSTYSNTTPAGTLTVGGSVYDFSPVEYSGLARVTGALVPCGLADTVTSCTAPPQAPATWIALIDRGSITFASKVTNVMAQGAAAAIIVNNDATQPDDPGSFTLGTPSAWIPTISVSRNSGALIQSGVLTADLDLYPIPYATQNGTSMATPHVSAAAALLKYARPDLTPNQIASRLYRSAMDLGPAGWDSRSGNGLLQLYNALTVSSSVEITAPGAGAVVTGAITLGARVPLVSSAATVDFTVRVGETDMPVGMATSSTPSAQGNLFETTWDTSGLPQGTYRLTATARDNPGAVLATDSVEIVVQSAPIQLLVRATRPDGSVAAGASVRVYRSQGSGHILRFAGTADADGVARIPVSVTADGGPYTVVLSTEQGTDAVLYYTQVTGPMRVELDGAQARRVTLSAVTVEGQLLDGAQAWVTRAGLPQLAGALGSDGTQHIYLLPGTYEFAAADEARGYYVSHTGSEVGAADQFVAITPTAESTTRLSVQYEHPVDLMASQVSVAPPAIYQVYGMPAVSGSEVVVTSGSYHVAAGVTVNDAENRKWEYTLTHQGFVPVSGTSHTVYVDTGLVGTLSPAPANVMPGGAIMGQVRFTTPAGLSLASFRWAESVEGPWTSGQPQLSIQRLDGETTHLVRTQTDTSVLSRYEWQVPTTATWGRHRLTVSVHAGPLGAAQVSADFIVGGLHPVEVLDPYGYPATGALVRVYTYHADDPYWEELEVPNSYVDVNGIVELPVDLALADFGQHLLQVVGRVEGDGFSEPYAMQRSFSDLSSLTVVDGTRTRKVLVQTTDQAGGPLPGLLVQVSPVNPLSDALPGDLPRAFSLVETGAEGTLAVWLDPGAYDFSASGQSAEGTIGYVLVARNVPVGNPVNPEELAGNAMLTAAGTVPVTLAGAAPFDHVDLILTPAGTRQRPRNRFRSAVAGEPVFGTLYVTPGKYFMSAAPELIDEVGNYWYYVMSSVREFVSGTEPVVSLHPKVSEADSRFALHEVTKPGHSLVGNTAFLDQYGNRLDGLWQENADTGVQVETVPTLSIYRSMPEAPGGYSRVEQMSDGRLFHRVRWDVPFDAIPGQYKAELTLQLPGQTVNQTAYFTIHSRADVNYDGGIDSTDLDILVSFYGQTISDPYLVAELDAFKDGQIDLYDLFYIASRMTTHVE